MAAVQRRRGGGRAGRADLPAAVRVGVPAWLDRPAAVRRPARADEQLADPHRAVRHLHAVAVSLRAPVPVHAVGRAPAQARHPDHGLLRRRAGRDRAGRAAAPAVVAAMVTGLRGALLALALVSAWPWFRPSR